MSVPINDFLFDEFLFNNMSVPFDNTSVPFDNTSVPFDNTSVPWRSSFLMSSYLII